MENLLPFLHLATCYFPDPGQGGRMLNKTLKLVAMHIRGVAAGKEAEAVRLRKECSCFVDVLGYHMTLMRPDAVTPQTVKLLNRIAQENDYLQEKVTAAREEEE